VVREELYINGTSVELQGSLQPNLTFNIQDIEQPDKRKATYSKTITLPGSKTINNLFNFIFEISTEGTFNPNLKATAKYMVDSQMILDGILQLKDIKYLDNSKIEYDVVLLGTIANLFTDLGDLELTDIQNLDDFNHPYTETHQALTWATSILKNSIVTPFAYGSGYVYPMINYGFDNSLDSYDYNELYPAFYVKELWDRIFSDAGYTYSSTFLSGDNRFRRAIIPYNGAIFGLSSATIANRLFTADTPVFSTGMTGLSLTGTSLVSFSDVSDVGGVHAAGVFTAPTSGAYDLRLLLSFNATFYPDPTATETVRSNVKLRNIVTIRRNGTPISSTLFFISPNYTYDFPIAGNYSTATSPSYPSDEYNSNVTGTTPYTLTNRNYNKPNTIALNPSVIWLASGDTIDIVVQSQQINIENGILNYFSTSNSNEYNGTWDLNITGTGSFSNNVVNTEYSYGDTVDMAGAVPLGIKQKDFVKSIINMFNLYIEPDTDNPNQLNIEPRDDFYLANTSDWSSKLDVSQDLVFTPMGLLDAGKYIYTYKGDKDYYNKLYDDTYDRVYGERRIDVDNDFLKNDKKQELIFSPTPLVGQSSNDRVVSTILKVDSNNQALRTDSNIRYLLYNGLKTTNSTWVHRNTYRTTYPFAGHLDDPFNPTHDVNFGLPYEIYYDDTFNAITLTDNNLYNAFHRKHLDEVTDPDSKIVKGMFYLTPLDIANLSFQNQYYFNGHQHRLLKVVNYNPANVSLTECHFLKLKTAATYTPITLVPDGGKYETVGSGSGSTEPLPTKSLYMAKMTGKNSYDNKTANVEGSDNIIAYNVKKTEVYGDGNAVGDNSENIYIKGDNNLVGAGLENVTIINSNDITVLESNVTYIDGIAQSGDDVVQQKSSNFTTELKVTTYECDTSGGDITVTVEGDVCKEGKLWNFKKTSALNNLIIEGEKVKGYTIDNAASQTVTKLNTNLPIQYDGGLNFIIL